MSSFASGGLSLLHILQTIWTCFISLLYYPFVTNPRPLATSRSKLPKKLALILADTHENPSEEEIRNVINNITKTVKWCKEAGIPNLAVYDRYGTLKRLQLSPLFRLIEILQELAPRIQNALELL